MQRLHIILAAILVSLVLSACTDSTGPSLDGPKFDGPWASEFETEYAKAASDYERAVLEDGTITEQEYAETVTRYKDCLGSVGITVDELLPNGQMSYTYSGDNSDDAVGAESECSVKSGYDSIGMLYSWIYVNPQQLDVAELTSACLVRSGAVAAGYSADDYRREIPSREFSFIVDTPTGEDAFKQCSSDPLSAYTE